MAMAVKYYEQLHVSPRNPVERMIYYICDKHMDALLYE
jgi:hypothetical protein